MLAYSCIGLLACAQSKNIYIYILMFCSQEKELIKKKQEEVAEAERAKRNKVVVTFDLVGRKVSTLCRIATIFSYVFSSVVM